MVKSSLLMPRWVDYDRPAGVEQIRFNRVADASSNNGETVGVEVRVRYGRLRNDFGLFGDDKIG